MQRTSEQHVGRTYSVQTWHIDQTNPLGTHRVYPDATGVSYDAAASIARAHVCLGYDVRIADWPQNYTEVWTPEGQIRCGRWEETTIVLVPALKGLQ